MAITKERAEQVLASSIDELPRGHKVAAWPAGSKGVIWLVNCLDAEGRPYAGSATLVGPDEQLWVLSSNPAIHDLKVGVEVLEHAYTSNLEGLLDQDVFADRIAAITRRRDEDLRDFKDDLASGSLRRTARRLP